MDESKTYKVLLVDDDKFLVTMYANKFKTKNIEVTGANSGEDALGKLREGFVPDIILLDIIMPGMDGIEILEAMKKENLAPKAVYIMLTNQGDSPQIEKARELGVHGYIVKATTIPSQVVDEVIGIAKKHI
ncbi:response regulator [Candidatus Parcubacteria bacterium]|nr:response regulator [Candidatus Parcubacteria bacterium]